MAVGMTSYPFLNKWQGFDLWAGWLGPLLAVLALAGLALSVFTAAGRLLLVVLIGSLLPYAVTWKLASDWRFTVHAYPFFLIAAPAGVLLISRGAGWLRQRGQPPVSRRALTFAAGWIVALAAGTWFITTGLPPRVVRETLASGQDASIMTGGRDSWFFSRGWSAPSPGVNVTTRVSRGGASDVRLPLVAGRPYRLTIRADPFPRPAEPGASLTIDAQFNGERLATLTIVFDPDRVGSASIEIPAARVRDGTNILTLQPAGQAQLELWYVRINPL
jgi:hypothetical protein